LVEQGCTLFDALVDARDAHGGRTRIVEDPDRRPLSYTDLIRAAFALGRRLGRITSPREHVGVLLPTSLGLVVTVFALHATGRIPVMLNFTAGARNVRAACGAAGVRRILFSRRFIAQGRLEDLVEDLSSVADIIYLEDIRGQIGALDRAYATLAGALPRRFAVQGEPDDIAVILFTSGSFGAPKGVALTHANLLSNVAQVVVHIPLEPNWLWFNPLPAFHSFGLTGGVLLPLMQGLRAFHYPSPLHYKLIPGLVRETKANVLLSTDTFVNQYARSSQADDLSALEFIVCGAERVRNETHELIMNRFGVTIVEGYGVTEASRCNSWMSVHRTARRWRRGALVGRSGLGSRLLFAGPSMCAESVHDLPPSSVFATDKILKFFRGFRVGPYLFTTSPSGPDFPRVS